jgi:Protein of unknown function with HXXEE motif
MRQRVAGGIFGTMSKQVKAGLLSGMAITWGTAIGAIGVGAFLPSLHPIFARAPSLHLLDLLLLSIAVMAVHKVECYFGRECDHCPVYLQMGDAPWLRSPRDPAFVAFCSVFLALAVLLALALRGGPWPLLVMAVWAAQGLHETHHLGKTLARGRYYPGTATAIAFVLCLDLFFVPAYAAHLGLDGRAALIAYYALQPMLVVAFWLEDRAWQVRYRWPLRTSA